MFLFVYHHLLGLEMKHLAELVWLLSISPGLMAQEAATDSILMNLRLDEVVVTGTGTEHYLKDVPVQTDVISGKALEQYQGGAWKIFWKD